MAVDKLVDSTQLNADLTSVANAIRTKGGTSAQLAFPAGFVSAVEAIPTGGGYSVDDIASGDPTGSITITEPTIVTGAFAYNSGITSITTNGTTRIKQNAFTNCSGLIVANLTGVTVVESTAVAYCNNLTTLNVEDLVEITNQAFRSNPKLSNTLKFKSLLRGSANSCFDSCTSLTKVYFYNTVSIASMNNMFRLCSGITDIYVPWAENAVSGAPWGATNATIHYNTTYGSDGEPL